jgi:hypothetical protein
VVAMGGGRGIGVILAALGLVVAASSCGAPAADPTVLPTFSAETSAADATTGAGVDEGAIPNDCERVLGVAHLNALLGLPLETVTVRSTLGVPEPSVGRTERLACRYSTRAPGPARGRLLDLNAASYSSPEAAEAQWRRNADIESGVHTDIAIGSAGAVLVERGGEALLSVVYGPATLTLILPDQPLPGGRPRAEALVDLALRVLPAVTPRTPPAPPAPAPTPPAVTAPPTAPAGPPSQVAGAP